MEKKNKTAIYQAKNGAIELQTDIKSDTVWATQSDLSILFNKDQSVISRHIKSIFKDGEVDKESNMQKMHIANSDKPVAFYALDIILAGTVAIFATIQKEGALVRDTVVAKFATTTKQEYNQTVTNLHGLKMKAKDFLDSKNKL